VPTIIKAPKAAAFGAFFNAATKNPNQ